MKFSWPSVLPACSQQELPFFFLFLFYGATRQSPWPSFIAFEWQSPHSVWMKEAADTHRLIWCNIAEDASLITVYSVHVRHADMIQHVLFLQLFPRTLRNSAIISHWHITSSSIILSTVNWKYFNNFVHFAEFTLLNFHQKFARMWTPNPNHLSFLHLFDGNETE